MKRVISGLLSAFKYFLALFMMYAGVTTAFGPVAESSNLGIVYETKPTLVAFGTWFFISGLGLLLSKLFSWKPIQGHSLFFHIIEIIPPLIAIRLCLQQVKR